MRHAGDVLGSFRLIRPAIFGEQRFSEKISAALVVFRVHSDTRESDMTQQKPQPNEFEPLAVRPARAFAMIGVGRTLGYKLLADGRLERVHLGRRAVGVTMASIKRLIESGV